MMFMTPGLPFVPTIAITVNIYLILKLSILTLVRFTIWMSLGKLYLVVFNTEYCYKLLLSLHYRIYNVFLLWY